MRLAITTFNIRAASVFDRRNPWSGRRDLILDAIRDSHVVGLQEVRPRRLRALVDALPGWHAVPARNPILFDASRFTLKESGHFPLLPARRRSCTWSVLADGDTTFAVVNAHLDQDVEAQIESAKRIAATCDDTPRVITADLNANERSGAVNVLLGAGLRDSFRDLHPDEEANTFHGFSGRGARSLGKIDAVLCDESWRVLSASVVGDGAAGRFPSDHFPVTAELEFVPQNAK